MKRFHVRRMLILGCAICVASLLSVACTQASASPALTPVAGITPAAPVSTATPQGDIQSVVTRKTLEYSDSMAGAVFAWRAVGTPVILKRCAGTRLLVLDQGQEAFIPAADLAVPPGFCPPTAVAPPTVKTAVIVVVRYAGTVGALANVQDFMLSLGPDDTLAMLFADGTPVVPVIHIPTPVVVGAPVTSIPTGTPCPLYGHDCVMSATATAEAAPTPTPADPLVRTAADRRARSNFLDQQAKMLGSVDFGSAPNSLNMQATLSRVELLKAHAMGDVFMVVFGPLQPPDPALLSRMQLAGLTFEWLDPECAEGMSCADWQQAWRMWADSALVRFDFADGSTPLTALLK